MKQQKKRRTARGPLIGYAIGLENEGYQFDCFGTPYEVLEELRARGLVFREIGQHDETGITSTEIFKAAPQMEIRGGPQAENTLELLDAIDEVDIARADRIIHRHPAALASQDDNSVVPMLAAVWVGVPDIVQLLLSNGAPVDKAGHLGMTPLHWAAAFGETQIVLQLMERGAQSNSLSWFFVTAAELAELNKHKKTVRAIDGATGFVSATRPPSVRLVLGRMAES